MFHKDSSLGTTPPCHKRIILLFPYPELCSHKSFMDNRCDDQMENYVKPDDSIQTSYYEAQRQRSELRDGSSNQPEDYL